MIRLLAAAVTLLVAIFSLLGVAAWNRGGYVQRITLTERELPLPYSWENGQDDDDAELRLALGWVHRDDPLDSRAWLTDDTLVRLGFSIAMPAAAPEAQRFYQRTVPRLGWLALEYNGPAWRALEAQRATEQGRASWRNWATGEGARLVPVGAAPDRDLLLDRYRDQPVLIVPAVFGMSRDMVAGAPLVYGRLYSLVAPDVAVPFGLRDRLRGFAQRGFVSRPDGTTEPPPPRYEVELAIGRLGAPWIADIRRLSAQ